MSYDGAIVVLSESSFTTEANTICKSLEADRVVSQTKLHHDGVYVFARRSKFNLAPKLVDRSSAIRFQFPSPDKISIKNDGSLAYKAPQIYDIIYTTRPRDQRGGKPASMYIGDSSLTTFR